MASDPIHPRRAAIGAALAKAMPIPEDWPQDASRTLQRLELRERLQK